jgi:hypothetical protein
MPSWALQGVVKIASAQFGCRARSFYSARRRVLLLAHIPHRLFAPTKDIRRRHEGKVPPGGDNAMALAREGVRVACPERNRGACALMDYRRPTVKS